MPKVKALVLLSGGLDSILAVKLLEDQGIEVVGLSFVTPFFGADNARQAADDAGIELIVEDITDVHFAMLKKPRYGYGRQMNPCIDCHTLMVRRAGVVMEREGFDFIATGEVLGERPMSQNREALMNVARHSGYGDVLVRPLSAKLLPETRPECEGKLDRSRLLDIQGRSRKPQLELTRRYGIVRHVQPAGGCLLTDPSFSARLKELLTHDPDATLWDVRLLKLGRHFRLACGTKTVVGRNESDNRDLLDIARPSDAVIATVSCPGPTSIVVGGGDVCVLDEAARLTAAHSDRREGFVGLRVRMGGDERVVEVPAVDRRVWEKYRI